MKKPSSTVDKTFKTKAEIARELGLSLRTFQRALEKKGLEVPRGLIAPDKQQEIYQHMGWQPEQ